jgi:hypothetical protein
VPSSLPFWLGLASIVAGSLIMDRCDYRWPVVALVFIALCFIAVLLKGM